MTPLHLVAFRLFCLAGLLYLLALVPAAFGRRSPALAGLALGLVANLASLGIGLYLAWPMQAPHQEPFWLPAGVAALALGRLARRDEALGRALLAAAAFLALFAAFFPKDYYLPFPRSHTIFAHLFLLFGVLAKAQLCAGGLAAGLFLRGKGAEAERGRHAGFHRRLIRGFVLYTLATFTAETWSYLGWSSPVIWEEPTMTTTMATWFYYGCFLHLYLLKGWPPRRRAWFALAGLPLMFCFNYLPETGPFAWPELGR